MKLYNEFNQRILLIVILLISVSTRINADNTVGLIQIDNNQSFEGYTLFAPNTSNTTYLIDMDGNLVHTWESDVAPGLSVYLLENGNLLRTAKLSDPDGADDRTGGFQILDWDGNVVWQYYQGTQHHDIEYIEQSGNVLMVVTDRQAKNAAIQAGRDPSLIDGNAIRSLSILEISQTGETTGEVVWQWNAWDHLIQEFDNTKDNFGTVAEHPELIDINYASNGSPDWLHTNSVAYNETLDQIIVSNRGIDEIWIIDHSTTTEQAASHEGGNSGMGGDILYRWGNPEAYSAGGPDDQKLFAQHDAHWIEAGLPGEGNILVFSNGLGRTDGDYSSVVEIEPPLNSGLYDLTAGSAYGPMSATWEYIPSTHEDFASGTFGGAQRLANGNTLVCNSNRGEFFELNTNDEIVWKYINPITTDGIVEQGIETIDNTGNWLLANDVFRCYRYSPDYTEYFDNLPSGNPIEIYNVSVEDEYNKLSIFSLSQNHPNPFNPTTNITFELVESSFVSLIIYDIVGNQIRTMVHENMEPGVKKITWNTLDDLGDPVSSGLYFYSVVAGQEKQTKKMMLLR